MPGNNGYMAVENAQEKFGRAADRTTRGTNADESAESLTLDASQYTMWQGEQTQKRVRRESPRTGMASLAHTDMASCDMFKLLLLVRVR